MKISYNWIQEYVNFELPPIETLVQKIGAQLGAVESVEDLGAKYRSIVVVKIASCRKIDDSDHLNVCLIDDAGVTPDVERDTEGLIQVVCGAPNVRPDITVAWLPPGSTVPSSADKDPFILGARSLRGVMSNGMLASPQELAIGDSHTGILELEAEHKPGTGFAAAYALDDYIIDIENKMFTHRPDCFGILGVAREIAGILGQVFTEPDWFKTFTKDLQPSGPRLPLMIRNEAPDLVPRLMAVALSGITIGPSSILLQTHLSRVGLRPINNIVDATNYFMHLTGQPLHAYDYDKVAVLDDGPTATLIARQSRDDDRLRLLNGKDIQPRAGAIVMATERQVIGLAGVMGGASTEVDNKTKNIILECATFEMFSIRKTSMTHGLFSEAVTRFNKGQSPLQNDRILMAASHHICSTGSAQFASDILDEVAPGLQTDQSYVTVVSLSLEFICARLGLQLTPAVVVKILTNVGFAVEVTESDSPTLTISVPFWRTDIDLPEDIVEEVGRLYGFDNVPLVLPVRSLQPAPKNSMLEFKTQLRSILSRVGANEILTYSFVHGNLLERVGQDKQRAYRLTNALSPDLQYYRISLTPSLLEKVNPNMRAGYDQFALFEIGKVHVIRSHESGAMPDEYERLSLVFAADNKAARSYGGAAYYQAKKYLELLLAELGLTDKVEFNQFISDTDNDVTRLRAVPYAVGRTAGIYIGGVCLGEVGEYAASVRKALKLPDFCAGFELDVTALLKARSDGMSDYVIASKYPKLAQDICLRVPQAVTYGEVFDLARTVLTNEAPLDISAVITPIDIYQRDPADNHKQITIRITFASYQKTLTENEVSKLLDVLTGAAQTQLQAERV